MPGGSTIAQQHRLSSNGHTNTTVSVSQLTVDVALLGRALAEVTDRHPTTTWESETPRDSTLAPPKVKDVLDWLPAGAELLYGRQNIGACQVLAASQRLFVQVAAYGDHVNVIVAADDADEAADLGRSVLERVPSPRELPDKVLLAVWSGTNDGAELTRTVVRVPRWTEIERNYPEGTRRELAKLMEYTPDGGPPGRLILLHGQPGTGKTHAIRALMAEWQAWCEPELVVDPESALFDYQYLRKLLTVQQFRIRRIRERWRLVIAEDADRFIRAYDRNGDNSALDRLLNATDGILGQSSKTLFLLTSNVELSTINPSLARPGRCLGAIGFEPFSPAGAREWLGEGSTATARPMTLAELYELKHGVHSTRPRKSTGLGQYL